MSLRSRTSSDLFAILHSRSRDSSEEIALRFFQEHANDTTNMNLQLTDLIFRCCGLTLVTDVPRELVRDENITGIVDILKSIISSSEDIPKLTLDKKHVDKALIFFENFWFYYWCELDADRNSFFFKKLVLALSKVELLPTVQLFCNRILSKLITSLLKNHVCISEQEIRSMHELTHSVMVDSFTFRNRQLLKINLQEFEQWLLFRPEQFTDDNFLRYVLWSMKECSPDVILIGLDLLKLLLSDQKSLPKKFLEQCVVTFSVINIMENDEIFARVCKCCMEIRSKFQHVLPSDLDRKLTQHLYALRGFRVMAAADYWLTFNYNPNNYLQSIRNIISTADSFSLKYVDYFTDSLIDKCPILTHWNLLAKLVADRCEEKLNAREKDVLLVIIVYAVQQTVTKKKPSLRVNINKKVNNVEMRRSITSAFAPHLKDLFRSPDVESSLLLKLVTFFDFNSMPFYTKEKIINSCLCSFEGVNTLMRRVIIEILWAMKMNCSDVTSEISLAAIKELKNKFETRVKNMFDDLLQNPNDYHNTVEGKKLRDAFLALRIIHVVVPVEKEVAFDAAIKILQFRPPALWNPTYMAIREACVILSTSHVLKNLGKEPVETGPMKRDALLLVLHFGNQLTKFSGNRSGMVIFGCLCDLALKLKVKDAMKQIPKCTINQMTKFFLVALSQSNLENLNEYGMRRYLEMIDHDVISMESAYNALSIHCNVDDLKYIRHLHQFLETQCEKRGTDFMVEWMTKLWIQLYECGSKSPEEEERLWQIYEKLRDLIYSIRLKIESFVYKCHISGIDYAMNEAKCAEFVRILSIFSPCLSKPNRLLVLNHVLAKDTNTSAMQWYIRSLKTKENLRAVITLDGSPTRDSSSASSKASVHIQRLSMPESPVTSSDGSIFSDSNRNYYNTNVTKENSNHNRPVSRSSSDRVNLNNYNSAPRLNDGDNLRVRTDEANSMGMDYSPGSSYNMNVAEKNFNRSRLVSHSSRDSVNLNNYSPMSRSSNDENLSVRSDKSSSMEVDPVEEYFTGWDYDEAIVAKSKFEKICRHILLVLGDTDYNYYWPVSRSGSSENLSVRNHESNSVEMDYDDSCTSVSLNSSQNSASY